MPRHKKAEPQIESDRPAEAVAGDDMSSEMRIARMLARDLRPARPLASADTWPLKAFESPDSRIRIATSTSELEDIGRLRYEVLSAGGDKTFQFADHSARQFVEPIDDLSLHLQYSESAKRTDAAVRLTRASDALSDPLLQLILDATRAAPTTCTVICSRFATVDNIGSDSIVPLFCQVYRSALVAGACYCLLAVRDEMTSMFETFGFRLLDPCVNDPIGGVVSLLRLDAYDVAYLRRVNSPCSAVAEELFDLKTIA